VSDAADGAVDDGIDVCIAELDQAGLLEDASGEA